MDHAARGAADLPNDPLAAVSHYTKALIEHPASPDYFTQRSTAFSRLKAPHGPRYDLALQDAELAVLLGQRRAKREKIQAAQQRRVVALFGLERYGDAALVLETMVKWRAKDVRKDQMEGDMWKTKIEQRMKACVEDDPKRDVTTQEFPEMELPSEPQLKKGLQEELGADGLYKFDGAGANPSSEAAGADEDGGDDDSPENELGNHTEVTSGGQDYLSDSIPEGDIKVERSASISHSIYPPTQRSQSMTASPRPMIPEDPATSPPSEAVPGSAPAGTVPKMRHEWYQTPLSVNITIYAKGVPKEQAQIEIAEDSVFISFPHPASPTTTFTFSLNPLFAPIDASLSTSRVMSTKVEVILSKQTPGQKWTSLEGSETEVEQATAATAVSADKTNTQPTAPAYPTSSKSGPKDWDKLADDLSRKSKSKAKKDKAKNGTGEGAQGESDSDMDSDYGGGDKVDSFFKKLYAGSDDDTRRAMMKSFQESGGTALSTNWAEVGKAKVDPVKGRDD